MLIRRLSALVAVAALVSLFATLLGVHPGPLWEGRFLVAFLVFGIGMAVRWGRWMSPQPDLALVTKLLGWGGACGVPLALFSQDWLAVGVCALLPACAWALWKDQVWVAWLWYAAALGAFWLSLWGVILAMNVLFEVNADTKLGELALILPVAVWVLFWWQIGFVLVREITAWRRRPHAGSATPSPALVG